MPRPQLLQPRLTSTDVYRLINAYTRAGEDIVARPWRVMAESMRRSVARVERGLLGPWSLEQVLGGLVREYGDLMFGLATTVPAVLETMITQLNTPPTNLPSEYHEHFAGDAPHQRGVMVDVGPDGDIPFVLPARVIDASQGWAAWFVPVEKVTALLAHGVGTGRIDADVPKHFEPFDCGRGRAMVVVLGVDYRISDFGRYREVALAFCLTPRDAAAEPGALFARLIVTDPFSLEPARRMWGFHKDCFEQLHARYRPGSVTFHTGHDSERDFSLILPRFGAGRSTSVPLVIYSARRADPADALAGPVRAILERSGAGEGAQIGGSVSVNLGHRGAHNSCFCSKPGIACLCDELRGLGIAGTLPAANGWTERMTGELKAPGSLGLAGLADA